MKVRLTGLKSLTKWCLIADDPSVDCKRIMDATHKSILPETVQALVEEIQTFAGFEIGVGENPKPSNPNDPPESSGSELTDEQLARISAGSTLYRFWAHRHSRSRRYEQASKAGSRDVSRGVTARLVADVGALWGI